MGQWQQRFANRKTMFLALVEKEALDDPNAATAQTRSGPVPAKGRVSAVPF